MEVAIWIIENKDWLFSGIGLAVITSAYIIFKKNVSEKRPIQEVSLKIIEVKSHYFQVAEFKLINESEVSAYITKIVLSLNFKGYGPVSLQGYGKGYIYKVHVLHADRPIDPYQDLEDMRRHNTMLACVKGKDEFLSELEIPVSQVVPPRGVDRIFLTFTSNANPSPCYRANASFIFNNKNKTKSDHFDIHL